MSEEKETRTIQFSTEDFDYEKIKDRLIVKVLNYETNKDKLMDVPFTKWNDLAICYCMVIEMNDEGEGSFIINNQFVDTFDIDLDKLKKDALENSMKLHKPIIDTLDNAMLGIQLGKEYKKDFDMCISRLNTEYSYTNLYVLSNEFGAYGAASMFYPGVMDKIVDTFDKSVFILPSSVHEVLVFPDDGTMNVSDLEEMVSEVNSTEVSAEDFLSNNVYYCDIKSHALTVA